MMFLQRLLSYVILIKSSCVRPVHVLILSIQLILGLPFPRPPGTVPCMTSFSKHDPSFLMMCPKYFIFLSFTIPIVTSFLISKPSSLIVGDSPLWGETRMIKISLSLGLGQPWPCLDPPAGYRRPIQTYQRWTVAKDLARRPIQGRHQMIAI